MAAKKRTGLGRGISSLIPTAPVAEDRPVDVFFGQGGADSAGADARGSVERDEQADSPQAPRNPRGQRVTDTRDSGEADDSSGENSSAPSSNARSTAARSRRTNAEVDPPTGDDSATDPAEEASEADEASAAARKQKPKRNARTPQAPSVSAERDEDELGQADADPAEDETSIVTPPDDEGLLPVPGARLAHIDPMRIAPNLRQPRTEFDQEALDELIISVREFGVLQPVVVRPIPADHPSADRADYELIMGERRLRASRAAELESIPAVIRDTPDNDMLRDALLENLHRSNLNPLEEASAYQQLLDDFGITQEELATRIGRSRSQISNTIRLLRLPVEVQRRVAAGVLSAGHARAVLSVGEPAAMTQLADKIVNEDLSVRAAEEAASRHGSRRPTSQGTAQPTGGLTGYLNDVGEQLGDKLNTRVRVSLRKTKGQIVIDFASINDLNRILAEVGLEME